MQVTVPQINMNGDTKESLLAEAKKAYLKLDDARCAVAAITVHGRNFQTMQDGSMRLQQALEERRELLQKLQECQTYAIELYNGIARQ